GGCRALLSAWMPGSSPGMTVLECSADPYLPLLRRDRRLADMGQARAVFEIVEHQVVAHIAGAGIAQRLVIPTGMLALRECLIDKVPAALARQHLLVQTLHVPALRDFGTEILQYLLMRRTFREIGLFQGIAREIEKLVRIRRRADIFPLLPADHQQGRD